MPSHHSPVDNDTEVVDKGKIVVHEEEVVPKLFLSSEIFGSNDPVY